MDALGALQILFTVLQSVLVRNPVSVLVQVEWLALVAESLANERT